MSTRRERNDSREPLLPWERNPDAINSPQPQMRERDQDAWPVLYGPHGEPLTRPRSPLGFRPPTGGAGS